MRVLFVGGTGLISSACVDRALAEGHQVWMLNRGRTRMAPRPERVRVLSADARDAEAVRSAVAGVDPDVVVQCVAFTPDQVHADLETFAGVGRTSWTISAGVYRRPPGTTGGLRRTPLDNPFWPTDKIQCERALAEDRTGRGALRVVRPSLYV